jgi:hypothetical protein
MTQLTTLKVFYSWQSDLSKDTNQKVTIKSCIKKTWFTTKELQVESLC